VASADAGQPRGASALDPPEGGLRHLGDDGTSWSESGVRVATSPKADPQTGNYARDETSAHRLDRQWSELVQELRVIGTGVQILFAFLLTIPFQARFGQADSFERDLYLVTLVLSALSAAILITPVALHRFLFKIGVKDEIVGLTNRLAITGLGVLSLCLVAGIVLTSDQASGALAAVVCGSLAAVILGTVFFALPLFLRRRLLGERGSTLASGREDRSR
jgi:Family of unknown function (DUF6328)